MDTVRISTKGQIVIPTVKSASAQASSGTAMMVMSTRRF
jgi:hypothetical protein